MNKEIFAKRFVLLMLTGAFVAGCSTHSSAPVRDSRPMPTRTTPKPLEAPPVIAQPVVVPPVARPGEHIVRQGETLYAVSRQYGVPVRELIAWNNLSRPEQLEVGQTLRVVAPGVGAESPALEPGASPAEVKREPRGGKEAWSEEAWARLQPQPSVPTATISRPELSDPGTVTPGTATPAAAAPGAVAPGAVASGDWIWPVKGTIISRFGEGSDDKARKGISIAGTPGAPVLAAAGGKVAYAGDAVRGYGNMIIIKHNDEYLTAYAHNRVILVKEGDTVTKGQKVAELGSTDSDRPKLHFELRRQGVPVDPLKYLPGL